VSKNSRYYTVFSGPPLTIEFANTSVADLPHKRLIKKKKEKESPFSMLKMVGPAHKEHAEVPTLRT
jgi:hypothetical protein